MSECTGYESDHCGCYYGGGKCCSCGVDGYTIGTDVGQGDIGVEERYMKPSAEYPDGSWLHKYGGTVMIATGYYATIYPDKPSPYWHGKPPFLIVDTQDWAWEWERKR